MVSTKSARRHLGCAIAMFTLAGCNVPADASSDAPDTQAPTVPRGNSPAAQATPAQRPPPGPGFTMYPLASKLSAVAPGATISFTIELAYVGPRLTDDHAVFLHIVSPNKPDWFDAGVMVPGPKASSWNGVVQFSGTITLPANATGPFKLMAGINHPQPGKESPNIRMTPADPSVKEHFGTGAIGYRYEIGAIDVAANAPPAGSLSAAAWSKSIIDDMTLPSEETWVANGSGSMQAHAWLASIGGSGGNYKSIVDICAGTCEHFAQNVSGAISWTWVWAGAKNKSQHTRVLARRARGYYLSKSSGKWVLAFDARPSGAAQSIGASTSSEGGIPDTQVQVDASTTSIKPDAFHKYELWGQGDIGHAAFTDAQTWFLSTQLSVVSDGSGIDDRAQSEFLVKVGADFVTSESATATDVPGAVARYINTATGRLVANTCNTCYPYKVMDGMGGRYRKIPTDGSWITVTAIGMSPTFGGSGLPPPWGDYTQPSPFAQPPYVLTPSEITAKPPPQ
jgi:hypothetical protein